MLFSYMADKGTPIEHLVKKQQHRQPQHQVQQHHREPATNVPMKPPSQVTAQQYGYQQFQQPSNMSFLDKIKSDKEMMQIGSVAAITFFVTQDFVTGMLSKKFQGMMSEGKLTMQGSLILAVLAAVLFVLSKKLI